MIEISIKVSGGSDFCTWQLDADDDDIYEAEVYLDDFISFMEKHCFPGTVTDC